MCPTFTVSIAVCIYMGNRYPPLVYCSVEQCTSGQQQEDVDFPCLSSPSSLSLLSLKTIMICVVGICWKALT